MIILNSYLTFCFSLFTVRFAHGFLARSLMELEELRRVCFFATNSANFLELFFTICFHSLSRLSALLFNPFRVAVSRGCVYCMEVTPLGST